MKKLMLMIMTCMLVLALTACGNNDAGSKQPAASTEDIPKSDLSESQADGSQPEEANARSLVVYFSATGNTKVVAENLAAMQDAQLYEIVPQQPYTDADLNYNDRSTRATVEQNHDAARPEISGSIDHLEEYDVIYVGFPIWWGDMPRILYTFFDTYDLSDKTIAPFCTSGGSGISAAVQAIKELEPSATVTDGLQTSASNAADDLTQWLSDIGLAKQE